MEPLENHNPVVDSSTIEHERPYRREVPQIADLQVTKKKFQREVETFKASVDSYRARGILLQKAEFPLVYVMFTAPHLKPVPVVFAARIDFTNYDATPPSLVLVDPFSFEPIPIQNVGTSFPKLLKMAEGQFQPQFLLQHYGTDDIPFLCVEGIKEYHLHPAHTGNSWFLHRQKGKGTLGYIVDQVYEYGILPLAAHQINVQVQISGYSFRYSQ